MTPIAHPALLSARPPAELPAPRRASRAWRVLHASDAPSRVAGLLESQTCVGMMPSLVTPNGAITIREARANQDALLSRHASLLNAWAHVRQWRKVILEASADCEFELVHAHCFAAGMAGVRNCPATVYYLDHFVEDLAPADAPDHGTWLSRSFRVAEQFVFSRAAAVIVPCESFRQAVIHRGAASENVFAIPDSIETDRFAPAVVDESWLASLGIDRWHRVLIHAPQSVLRLGTDGALDADSRALLESFAMAASEEDGAYLLIESDEAAVAAVRILCASLDIDDRVKLIASSDRRLAFDAAHIIVAGDHLTGALTPAANPVAFDALLSGKALLAADLPCNRDVTPSGRGCLWFRSGDPKDLAYRMAFLSRNRDFRMSLAESGQRFLHDTRDHQSIALEYDRVYRHAAARRRAGGLQTPAITLTPAQAML